MLTPVLGWIFIKPYLLSKKQLPELKRELIKLKYNADVFKKLINENAKYGLLDLTDSLTLGNQDAKQIITMVSTPYCQPCSIAHNKLNEWLYRRTDIKLQIIFLLEADFENGKNARIATHLLTLQLTHDKKVLEKAVNDWYHQENKNYEQWAKSYPIKKMENQNKVLRLQQEWLKTVGIKSAPIFFINGFTLPSGYQVHDLKYIL